MLSAVGIAIRDRLSPHRGRTRIGGWRARIAILLLVYFTVMSTASEGIPLAITTNVLGPVCVPGSTSNSVLTTFVPVSTPVLKLCVRA